MTALHPARQALHSVQEKFSGRAEEMRQEGRKWGRLLSFSKAPSGSLAELRKQTPHFALPEPGAGTVVPALELLLTELLYHPGTKETPRSSADPRESGLSCETPFHCPRPSFLLEPTAIAGLGAKGAGDKRSYLCKHVHRFVGQYKMVFNQKCVRVLWPLRPGFFKPHDEQRLSERERAFVTAFHRRGFADDLYPLCSAALASRDPGPDRKAGFGSGGVLGLADLA